MSPADQTFTYRGRSLEELVPRIRQELGDDAVIVARRETTSGGVGGFFAKREIEVDVRPGESAIAAGLTTAGDGAGDAADDGQQSAAARAFAQQLAQAQERHALGGAMSSEELMGRVGPTPATSPEIDALPRSSDVTVDDLFPPAPPAKAQGLAALFNAGKPAEPEPPAAEPHSDPSAAAPEGRASEPVVPAAEASTAGPEGPALSEPAAAEPIAPAFPEAAPVPEPEIPSASIVPPSAEPPIAAQPPSVPEPEGPITFEWPAPRAEGPPADEPAAAVPEAPAPAPAEERLEPRFEREPGPEPAPVEQPTGMFDYVGLEPTSVEPPASAEPRAASAAEGGLPLEARAAVERLADRGLRPELAAAVAEEAMASLHPLQPAAEPRALVLEAMARRIPMHPLGRGAGVVGFVGPAGAGKTRCVARLAAAHARHGAVPVTVVALRSPDGGAELTRLLAPYGVTLHAVDSGAEGAARIASLRGEQLVIVDTPGVSPRSSAELRALRLELDALAPDELHLAVSATVGPAAARELVRGVRELGVGALAVTHTDETEMLGTVIGLAIDCSLPMSYLSRGQAVDAGLSPASARELAEELLA